MSDFDFVLIPFPLTNFFFLATGCELPDAVRLFPMKFAYPSRTSRIIKMSLPRPESEPLETQDSPR